jgi:hypothetical protein
MRAMAGDQTLPLWARLRIAHGFADPAEVARLARLSAPEEQTFGVVRRNEHVHAELYLDLRDLLPAHVQEAMPDLGEEGLRLRRGRTAGNQSKYVSVFMVRSSKTRSAWWSRSTSKEGAEV